MRKRVHNFPVSYMLQQLAKALKAGKTVMKVRGYDVQLDPRTLTYVHDGTTCRHCGLEATHWGLDHDNFMKGHLNLYGERNGSEVMMTSDHMNPRSLGGSDTVENRQCLCASCNGNKGNSYVETKEERWTK